MNKDRLSDDPIYARYVRPLEKNHWGQFAAVSDEGAVILGAKLLSVAQEARDRLGPGVHLFKVGEVAIGRAR